MLFYSKASQYALRALSYLVKNQGGGLCRVETIAKQEDIPKYFLSNVMKDLVKAKILKSIKGPAGGFEFAREPEMISLYQVINVFDHLDDELKTCAIGWKECSDENACDLHNEYKRLREHVRDYFKRVNLATFTRVAERASGDHSVRTE